MSVNPSAEGIPIVIDTNVLLSLYVFADSRYAPLRTRIESGEWQAITNEPCLAEFARVLTYPMFKLPALTQQTVLTEYKNHARQMDFSAPSGLAVPLPRCTDVDDQKFLELARDGRARWLITCDKALLKLARRLRQARMFLVVTPEAVLREI